MSLDQKAQPQADRVYEEFEPPFDWDRDEGSDTLILVLPGFKKEQLKVQVTSNRLLRVSGERQISENKWRRFRREFSIPSHSDISRIGAKFEAGMLYVRLSKLINNNAPTTPPPPSSPPPPPPPPPPPTTTTTTTTTAKPTQEAQQQPTTQKPIAEAMEDKKPRVEDKPAEQKTHEEVAKPRIEKKAAGSKNDEKGGGEVQTPLLKEHKAKADEDSKKKEKGKAETGDAKEREDQKMHGTSEVKKMEKRSLTLEALSRQSQEYMNAFSGLMEEVKRQRKLVNSLVLIFFVLLLVLYVMNAVKSFLGGSKSQ